MQLKTGKPCIEGLFCIRGAGVAVAVPPQMEPGSFLPASALPRLAAEKGRSPDVYGTVFRPLGSNDEDYFLL